MRRPSGNRASHPAGYRPDSAPLAYLISFRCYGSWLHGDARGSTGRRRNTHGMPFIPPDAEREALDRYQLSRPPVRLDRDQRAVVERTIAEVREYRGWALQAVSARSNHVHAVVTADASPERVMDDLKARSTRCLREAGLVGPEVKPWSRHGSTRYLWTPESVDTAIRYVLEAQDEQPPSGQ